MSIPGKTPFVFVADDERIIADTLAIILNNSGYEAVAFYSGEQIVEASTLIKPDAVIADVVMGGISGIEAAIRIREALPGCPILLLSGQATTAHPLHACVAEHRFEILPKPIEPQALLARLNQIVEAGPGRVAEGAA